MADIETSEQEGTGQCEITGKWVPQDELVVIHGRRVCAEGKAELLDRLRGGERLPGEMDRPTALRRFACIFVDNLILGVFSFAVLAILFGTVAFSGATVGTGGGVGFTVVQFFVGGLIPCMYFTALHGTSGQTLGKKAGKVKVVKLDGTDIDVRIALVRFLWYQGPALFAALLAVIAMAMASLAFFRFVAVLHMVSGVYLMISCVLALMDRDQQRAIHDRLTGTRVIILD